MMRQLEDVIATLAAKQRQPITIQITNTHQDTYHYRSMSRNLDRDHSPLEYTWLALNNKLPKPSVTHMLL